MIYSKKEKMAALRLYWILGNKIIRKNQVQKIVFYPSKMQYEFIKIAL